MPVKLIEGAGALAAPQARPAIEPTTAAAVARTHTATLPTPVLITLGLSARQLRSKRARRELDSWLCVHGEQATAHLFARQPLTFLSRLSQLLPPLL